VTTAYNSAKSRKSRSPIFCTADAKSTEGYTPTAAPLLYCTGRVKLIHAKYYTPQHSTSLSPGDYQIYLAAVEKNWLQVEIWEWPGNEANSQPLGQSTTY